MSMLNFFMLPSIFLYQLDDYSNCKETSLYLLASHDLKGSEEMFDFSSVGGKIWRLQIG